MLAFCSGLIWRSAFKTKRRIREVVVVVVVVDY